MTLLVLVLAVAVGIALGMLGGGGSILMVPLLVEVARLPAAEAIAMSLLVVMVTAAAAAVPHAAAGRVAWRPALVFGATAMPAAFVAGRVGAGLDGDVLILLFAVVMLAAASAMLGPRRPRRHVRTASTPRMLALGTAVGAMAGLVGAGGGFLVVPAMTLFAGLAMPEAIATSLVVITLQSGAGLVGHLGTTSLDVGLTLAVTSATVVGSVVGARRVAALDPTILRRAFAVLVAGLAGHLAADALPGSSWVWVPTSLAMAGVVARARSVRRARQPADWVSLHDRTTRTPDPSTAAPSPARDHHDHAATTRARR